MRDGRLLTFPTLRVGAFSRWNFEKKKIAEFFLRQSKALKL